MLKSNTKSRKETRKKRSQHRNRSEWVTEKRKEKKVETLTNVEN